MISGTPQDPQSACSHLHHGEVQGRSDARIMPSASLHTHCSLAPTELERMAYRTDGGSKISLPEVVCGKHFYCLQPCPL